MNGIEKITARIESDGKAQVAVIMKEAEDKAAEIRARFEAEAREATQKAAEAAERAALQQVERMESAARMEAKTRMLSAKQHLIDKAFEAAEKELLGLGEKDRTELLARLAAKASQTGKEEIVLNKHDREAIGEKVVQRANQLKKTDAAMTLSAETRDITGGVILKEGNVEINSSFETQLRVLRDSMAGEVAKTLFG